MRGYIFVGLFTLPLIINKIKTMDIVDQLAEMRVKEYEQRDKRLSFELARLTVQTETCDGMVWTLMHDPEMSAEKMADFLNVPVWFVETSIARYKNGKNVDSEPPSAAWGQILEMRKRDDPKSRWSDERRAYYEKDSTLRIWEQLKIAETFLTDTNHSTNRIADLTGLRVSDVEKLKRNLEHV